MASTANGKLGAGEMVVRKRRDGQTGGEAYLVGGLMVQSGVGDFNAGGFNNATPGALGQQAQLYARERV